MISELKQLPTYFIQSVENDILVTTSWWFNLI